MSYSTDITNVLAAQLERFASSNRHQLASQLANLDFWLIQIEQCLRTLDDYPTRFKRLKAAHDEYVARHKVVAFDLQEPELKWKPMVERLPDSELKKARHRLCEAAYKWLTRCAREQILDEARVRVACTRLGIGVEATDLRKAAK